ncbi:hypothetical protein DDB_G0276629 [Dictyostelium discoideum AX4]|uniref:Uncharacterized protein n=1 Tax=Dictyostelium discoideum TaxID=44689 RepID=Q551D8_DICDI|nr:hypothetical protein DDB_G0276629 [Dictyostelium discoideum AX4]EAL69127.1 hypothetical protein DDB_G0276629 [Dictyostelium discoideum AX4]|eukprot:XP_643055.1 hypothetical protein DDB_G0276629 [Dictyostelium discoideum AX4]
MITNLYLTKLSLQLKVYGNLAPTRHKKLKNLNLFEKEKEKEI